MPRRVRDGQRVLHEQAAHALTLSIGRDRERTEPERVSTAERAATQDHVAGDHAVVVGDEVEIGDVLRRIPDALDEMDLDLTTERGTHNFKNGGTIRPGGRANVHRRTLRTFTRSLRAMTDWPTIASLATVGGTLVLATATFASVRSGNRTARGAEGSLLAGIRPLLLESHLQDAPQKIMWIDQHFAKVAGGRAVAEEQDDVIYLAASLRNVGAGVAVLHGWYPWTEGSMSRRPPADPEQFRRLTRDLYIPPGDTGFFQAAIRDADDPDRAGVHAAIAGRLAIAIDVLYGDYDGGQRTITRFVFTPIDDGWLCSASRHWNLDRQDPR